jgi:hypothetical protein
LFAQVDAASGSQDAFFSPFTLSLSNEIPESTDYVQLTYSFGWKRLPNDDITLISQTRSTDDGSPSILETILPPGIESRFYQESLRNLKLLYPLDYKVACC